MRLEAKELRMRLRERFGGKDLLYQLVHTGADDAVRPIAQLTRDPRIPTSIVSIEPRSLIRGNSSLHVKGIIHHEPKTKGLEN